MKASSVTDLLFNQLSFRGDRQNVISSNIANINTPNYKTKELVFDKELKKVQDDGDLKLSTTNGKHISNFGEVEKKSSNSRIIDVEGLEEQNDGNNVNLDQQMSEMSKNKVIFDAIQASITKDSRLFRSVIDSSAKN
jgi:flagellar basal-body rod protein FlgB